MCIKADTSFEVDFEPVGRRAHVRADQTLLDAALSTGVELASLCGGAGLCDSCIVRLREGLLSELTLEEQSARQEGWLLEGERLACQAYPQGDVIIDIPPSSLTSSQRLQLEARQGQVSLDPMARAFKFSFQPASIRNSQEMVEVLQAALRRQVDIYCDSQVREALSISLGEQASEGYAILRDDELIGILPVARDPLGLAVDLGTTKLAVYLLNLKTGQTMAHAGAMNPQISYGEDVISRIAYANRGDAERATLSRILIERLNEMVADLCKTQAYPREAIVDVVVVGNTVMHHTFLGLPIRQLGVTPFSPAVEGAQILRAREVGLVLAPGAYVYLPPNIAGYIGADHTAVLLSTSLAEQQNPALVVDIGTNTEISLKNGDWIMSCSCASGPAFEGAHIRDGMRAAPGAVERVQPANGGLRWGTVDRAPPIGICGSGILDAVAALRALGWVDRSGRVNQDAILPEYQHAEGIRLVEASQSGHGSDIVITRNDIHEVQLAQGAIRAGIEVLLNEGGIEARELEQVYLAGAFGTYLNVGSAMASGMLPAVDATCIHQVGNAAGEGARQLLLSREKRLEAEAILQKVVYIELTTHPAFTDLYMKHLFLG